MTRSAKLGFFSPRMNSNGCNSQLTLMIPIHEHSQIRDFVIIDLGIDLNKVHSFIHSDHFYSAPSSPLPLRGAPDYSTDTVSEFHAEAHRQLQVKDLPKVPT